MSNLEFYKDELKEMIGNEGRNASLEYKWKVVGEAFAKFIEKKSKKQHIFDKDRFGEGAIDWLLEEHKEPIKLKQWEYDAIKYHGQLPKFHDIHFLMAMKNKGYFKDMNSVEKCSMTIKEILENCEVEDR